MFKRLTVLAATAAVGIAISAVNATAAHAYTYGLYASLADCNAAGVAGQQNGLWGPAWWCTPIQVGSITDYVIETNY